ncbi:hypothetical protein LEP1GSC085_2337 [Leptospira interrogans str. L0996]|nr:hypothetical protein LEP1GSC085_2337 [Leptospira interrogans str. L0996]
MLRICQRLIVRNTTKEDFIFWAPHSMLPAEGSLGFKFKCLCVNHAFYIPSNEIWYRVIELRIGTDLSKGLILIHLWDGRR